MKHTYDLSTLRWQVAGYTPHGWRFGKSMEIGADSRSEVTPVPAPVPGSVQQALLDAELIPDWNVGLDARAGEWVENRHWIYFADLPDNWLQHDEVRLVCDGLDYSGWILVNQEQIATFKGTFVPHTFDLKPHLQDSGNTLQIVFDCPPRWLGQFGFTSQMTEWKTRFNYTWDWTSRLVQIGIWDGIRLDVGDGTELTAPTVRAGADLPHGWLEVRGGATGDADRVRLTLTGDDGEVCREEVALDVYERGFRRQGLDVALWWPNGHGDQPLYRVKIELLDTENTVHDCMERQVGFKHLVWESCAGAPVDADPWVCAVNGKQIFLCGVNWTPIRPNFADVPEAEYVKRLELYADLGFTMLRVWGGAVLGTDVFYRHCDRLGLLVWQEFPLSSSGMDNWPPEDPAAIDAMDAIARSYIARRRHHVSLAVWCGGNELQQDLAQTRKGCGLPVTCAHPLIRRLADVVGALDPDRRFLPSSSSGPRFTARREDFGKNLHWDVHGPWRMDNDVGWADYWENDDALFRSETGAPSASPADIIRGSKGDLPELPGTVDNPLWRRTNWWIEWETFRQEQERAPESLEEYVDWSQSRQARALVKAMAETKNRFPAVGGLLLWMGHDSFPCTANTAIVDMYGRPKPAALALREVCRNI